MSEITLSVLRCPDAVVPGQRRAGGGEISIGRSAEADWQLSDPERLLSRKHCVLEFRGGGWQVRDTSANGTFLNHATAPIGRDQAQPLSHGDRLRLGAYEIEVGLTDAASPAAPGGGWADAASPFADAPPPPGFGPASAPPGFAPPGFAPPDFTPTRGSGVLPDDWNPLAEDRPPMPDHAPATAEAFLVPPVRPVAKGLIPDDWDLDAPAPPPRPAPPLPAAAPPVFAAPPPPAAPLPDPFLEAEDVKPPAPPPRPSPPDEGRGLGESELGRSRERPSSETPLTPPGGEANPAQPLAALLQGAGLPNALAARARESPDEALHAAGAVLRAAVAGIRALLIARADVKREFRIEGTMMRPGRNNPLKFSADDDTALAAMLDADAARAMQETVDDLTAHQVATLAATQAAARALLERLAPKAIEADDPGGGLLPGAREKRLWEAYRRRHAQLLEQFEDDFDSAFGKAFARAYEQAAGRRGA